MKRLLAALFIFVAGISVAQAQNSKATMITQTTNCFPDNIVGAITPSIARGCFDGMINSYQQYAGVRSVSGTTDAIVATDYGQLVNYTSSSAIAASLPQALSSFATFNVSVKAAGSGTLTVTPTLSAINGAATLVLTAGQSAWIISDGTNYQAVINAGSSAITALTGDVTATGPGSASATLATVNSNVGAFGSSTAIPNITVNGKGLITAAGTNVVIAPAGTLTGSTLASGVTGSSLTSVGTLSGLTVTSSFTATGLVTNADLVHPATTVNGQTCTLGSTCTVAGTLTVGGTTISSGVASGLLISNAGTLGQTANSFAGPAVINQNSLTSYPSVIGSALQVIGADGAQNGLQFNSFINGGGIPTRLRFQSAEGTGSSPTAILSNDDLGQIAFEGYDGSAYDINSGAGIDVRATQNWSGAAHGTSISLSVIPNGSTSRTTAVTLGQDQTLTVVGNVMAPGYVAGASPGVSCSGAPTGSFASINGIVTHC